MHQDHIVVADMVAEMVADMEVDNDMVADITSHGSDQCGRYGS